MCSSDLNIKEGLDDFHFPANSLPIKQMFIFCRREMDKYAIVSFHTVDMEVNCQTVRTRRIVGHLALGII